MNYRHAFHAGNFADVLKHALLSLTVQRLAAKDAPFMVLDTHAGAGGYDLGAAAAARTGEWRDGIGRVLAARKVPSCLKPYLSIVRAFDRKVGGGGEGLRFYPGSPRIVRALLRPGDRLVACELHPQDGLALKREFAGDRPVEVRLEDGYGAIKALLPPAERRGLVLIDAPFEKTDEFATVERALGHVRRRFATGVVMVWYPVKDEQAVAGFHAALGDSGMRRVLVAELDIPLSQGSKRLARCGIAIGNAPWPLEDYLAELMPWLGNLFGGRASWRWVVPD